MTTMFKEVSKFLGELDGVSDQLGNFRHGLEDREARLLSLFEQFRVSTNSGAHEGSSRNTAKVPHIVAQSLAELRAGVGNWAGEVGKAVRGREFISQFERSIVVLVNGKVNSGKSTLGNFLAGTAFRGRPGNPYEGRAPQFVQFAEAGGQPTSAASDGFNVKVTECTTSIQGFTLGGMTWVDSPGLHSLTHENGELARQYADHAELVVYLTESDSPLRRSDRDEVARLCKQGKRLLILVPKFDKTEERYDDDDNVIGTVKVPKPDQSRTEQQGWIEDEIRRAGLQDVIADRHYCFVSTQVAERAMAEDDPQLFEASGIPDLYRQIARTLRVGPQAIKSENPRRRFNTVVDGITGTAANGDAPTIPAQVEKFNDVMRIITEERTKLTGVGRIVAQRVRSRAAPKVQNILQAAARDVESGGTDRRGIRDDVNRVIAKELTAVLDEEVRRVLSDADVRIAKSAGVATLDIPAIKAKYETLHVSQDELYKQRGSLIGSLLGGLAAVALGPAGLIGAGIAIAAGAAGGAAGGALGKKMADDKSLRVMVGTDVESVTSKVFDNLESALPDAVAASVSDVADQYFAPREKVVTDVLAALGALKRDVESLKYAAR